MTQRITAAMLESKIKDINGALGRPNDTYAYNEDGTLKRDEHGRLTPNGGVYYIGGAYGGFRIEQMTEGGGARDISPRGTRRETYDFANGILHGIHALTRLQNGDRV